MSQVLHNQVCVIRTNSIILFFLKGMKTKNAHQSLSNTEKTHDTTFRFWLVWLVWLSCIGWVGFGLKTRLTQNQLYAANPY